MTTTTQRKIRNSTGRVLAIGRHIGRAPRRTGQPEWFRRMKHEIDLREYLKKLRISFLASKLGVPPKIVAALQVAGYRNVWEVSQANITALKAVRGLGDSGRKTLFKALRDSNIATAWSVG